MLNFLFSSLFCLFITLLSSSAMAEKAPVNNISQEGGGFSQAMSDQRLQNYHANH